MYPRQRYYLAAYVPELLEGEGRDVRTRRLLAIFEELAPDRQDEVIDYLEMLWKRDVARPPREPRGEPGRIDLISERKK